MTTTNPRTLRRLLAAFLSLALVLAGCGDDDDTGTDDAADAADAAGDDAGEDDTAGDDAGDEMGGDEMGDDETGDDETGDAASGGDISAVATAAEATFIPSYTQYAPEFAAAVTGAGPVTALMPSDEAFMAFSGAYPDLTNEMRNDFDALDRLLQYHVLDGAQLRGDLEGKTEVTTLLGEPIAIEIVEGDVVLNGGQARISEGDLEASNGVVHILDGILLPPSMVADAS